MTNKAVRLNSSAYKIQYLVHTEKAKRLNSETKVERLKENNF